jgi:hypothetical protein
MTEYHKINTIWKRDTNGKIIPGEWSMPEFRYLANCSWEFTEKIDGTNVRVMWDGQSVRFNGKTDNAQMPVFLYEKLVELFPAENLARVFAETTVPVCLYGEGYGARIQKCGGNYIPDGCSFILFDVKVGDLWLTRFNVMDIADGLKVQSVPSIGSGSLHDAVAMVRDGIVSVVAEKPDTMAEGIVIRPIVELKTRTGQRIIAKLKTRDYA